MSTSYSTEIIDQYPEGADNQNNAAPVNVVKWVTLLSSLLNICFNVDPTDLKNPENAGRYTNMIAYVRRVYFMVVFKGKEFKSSINAVKSAPTAVDDEEVSAETEDNKIKYKGNVAEFDVDGLVWAGVIKGTGNDSIRPHLHEVVAGDKKYEVPIVTVKLFQACISCILMASGDDKGLHPAPLMANVIRCCRNDNKREFWLIHGHSGFNFVANFIASKKRTELIKKKKFPYLKEYVNLSDMLYIAMKFDIAQGAKDKDGEAAYPLIQAIVQTCQFTQKEIVSMAKNIKKDEWGSTAMSVSKEIAQAFVNATMAKEKPATKKKQVEEEDDDDDTIPYKGN